MESPQVPLESRHKTAVRVLVVLASLLAFLSIFTTWVDRQALDTNAWVDTSGRLLENKQVSDAVAVYAVDQLYANVDVARLLHKRLPRDLRPLSGPAAGGLREVATRAAKSALRTSRVQQEWKQANRVAHQTFLSIIEDRNSAVSTQGGVVVLNLRPLIGDIATRVGIDKNIADKIPPDAAQLQVLQSKDLDLAQKIVKAVKGLTLLFSLGTLALFALAVYLAAGRRWVVVLGYGLGLVAAGVAALAVRKVAGSLVVDQLAQTETVRPAAEATWSIGTSLLKSIATTVIAYGALFGFAAFLASPADQAIVVRQGLAPSLRDRPAIVWGIFSTVVLLFLIFSPPASSRELLTTLALIALAAGGLEALRRKTAAEFPNAAAGEWREQWRARMKKARKDATQKIGSAVRELTDDDDDGGKPKPVDAEDARLDRLAKLAELHRSGALTDEEFAAEKKRVLGAAAPAARPGP